MTGLGGSSANKNNALNRGGHDQEAWNATSHLSMTVLDVDCVGDDFMAGSSCGTAGEISGNEFSRPDQI